MAGFDNDVIFGINADYSNALAGTGASTTGQLLSDGQLWIGSTATNAGGTHINVGTISAGTGITVTNGSGSITIASTAGLTDLHVARFIVASSTLGTGANYTTIASAIAAAQATGIPSTVFIQPGTYTENLTLIPNINLTAFDCDASLTTTSNVIIKGTLTLTTAGTVTISGIQLQTNSAALLAVTGSAASVVNLTQCFLNCTNNSGITFSASNAAAQINLYNCNGNLGTTGIAIFIHSSTGSIIFENCQIMNSGASTTASTCSAGSVTLNYTQINSPITQSGTASLACIDSVINCTAINTTALTQGGSGANQNAQFSYFGGGSASAISISQTLAMNLCNVSSSNTNAITGGGTLINGGISFVGTSYKINTSTQTAANFDVGGISFDGGTNVLSTYTVGTWTPTLQGSTTGGSTGYTNQFGYYIRVGAEVQIQFILTASSSTGTGNVTIGGLPFTIKNQTSGNVYGSVINASATFTWPALTTSLAWAGTLNTTNSTISCSGTGTNGGSLQMANGNSNFQGTMVHQI